MPGKAGEDFGVADEAAFFVVQMKRGLAAGVVCCRPQSEILPVFVRAGIASRRLTANVLK